MFRILIVEDTPEEADRLVAHLERFSTETGEVFAVERLGSAVEFVERRPPADLVFMDIQLPGLSGMEAAQALRGYDEATPLIFVTNLAQYAVEGYTVSALDFLVKPVGYAEFRPRMERALRVMARARGETISLPTSEGTRVVPLASVAYIDMLRHDLLYHVSGEDEPLRQRGSVRQAEAELAPRGFLRISSGCIVNMGQVRLVRRDSVVLGDGTELYFSRSRRKACLEALANYLGGGA